jgi:HK97 family phage portal protein
VSLFGGFERRDFGGVHNPFENPTMPLSSVGLDQIYGSQGSTDAGESVTPEVATQIPTYWRCVGLLSTVVASCPLNVYRDPSRTLVDNKLLSPYNYNTSYTPFELWELVICHLCLWGNAYVLKVRAKDVVPDHPDFSKKGSNGEDAIVDLKPINPALVEVSLDKKTGHKVFEIKRLNKDGSASSNQTPIILTTNEVMHIAGLNHNGLKGISPVENAARTLGTSIAADKLAARFYKNGTTLTGVINVKAPLTSQTQADDIRRRWASKNGGINAAAEVAVLDAETSFTPLTIPPDSLQFLESRRWQTTEIARMFGIPPHLVGDVEKSTSWGTGIEQQNVGFVSYTVGGWTNRIAQRVAREIIHTNKQYCEFNLDHLMRGSMSERYAAYQLAINSGWMSRNEARDKEDMLASPGLDVFLTPMNMFSGNPPTAKQAAANAKAAVPPPPTPSDNDDSGNGNSDDSDSGSDS